MFAVLQGDTFASYRESERLYVCKPILGGEVFGSRGLREGVPLLERSGFQAVCDEGRLVAAINVLGSAWTHSPQGAA